MRIPSGVTDQYIYFVAVDSTDLKTRETGLSSFTVYRSRNGGVATAYTTPTINETSSANMPGVYELLLDEDMTIDSGDVEQEVCLHITHAGMAPVTRIFTLFRPVVSAGETLGVSGGIGNAAVQTIAAGAVTASAIATGAIDADALASDAVTEIQTGLATSAALTTVEGKIDTIDINVDAILVDTGTDIPASLTTIDGNVDAILVDTGTTLPTTLTTIEGKIDTVDTVVDSIQVDTNSIEAKVDIINTNVDAVLVDTGTDIPASIANVDSDLAALTTDIGVNGSGLTAIPWNAAWDAEVESEVNDGLAAYDAATGTDVSSVDVPTVSEIADAVWDEVLSGHAVAGTTGEALSDASTGSTPPTADAIADEVATRTLNVNITKVNNVDVTGSGTNNDPWGPS